MTSEAPCEELVVAVTAASFFLRWTKSRPFRGTPESHWFAGEIVIPLAVFIVGVDYLHNLRF